MKDLYIVANWKANKNEEEARGWIQQIGGMIVDEGVSEYKKVIVCPSFVSLSIVRQYIVSNNIPLKIGAQDVSRFGKGAYTGEVPAGILGQDIDYVIIGHSERRSYFNEDEDVLHKKVANALAANIIPIYCVQSADTPVPKGVKIVAYEPISAIGTGNPDTPENAEKVAISLRDKNADIDAVLYGGSVKDDNVKSFVEMPNIDGVLIGGSSLEASSFASIISKC